MGTNSKKSAIYYSTASNGVLAMFARLFIAHPQSVGESYFEHQRVAFSFAGPCFWLAALASCMPSIPGLCERTAASGSKCCTGAWSPTAACAELSLSFLDFLIRMPREFSSREFRRSSSSGADERVPFRTKLSEKYDVPKTFPVRNFFCRVFSNDCLLRLLLFTALVMRDMNAR